MGGVGLEVGKFIVGRVVGIVVGGVIGKVVIIVVGGFFSVVGGFGSVVMIVGGFLVCNVLKVVGGVGIVYGLYSVYDNVSKGNYGSVVFDLGFVGVSGVVMFGGIVGLVGFGFVVLIVGGVVFSGVVVLFSVLVVLSGLVIVGVVYGGYKFYKYLIKLNMKLLFCLRMV